jgi:hypothetical protein
MKTIGNILMMLVGAVMALLVVEVVQKNSQQGEKWQDAWEHSSRPTNASFALDKGTAGAEN